MRTLSLCLTLTLLPAAAAAEPVPDFRTQIEPVLTKAGCNSGACHGALAGKGGLKLSLRGYDPDADHFVLTRQALLILREPGHGAGRPGGTAAGRALQRAGEAARLLGGADLQVQVLDGGQVTALLAACADPAAPPRPAGRAALPGRPVTFQGRPA